MLIFHVSCINGSLMLCALRLRSADSIFFTTKIKCNLWICFLLSWMRWSAFSITFLSVHILYTYRQRQALFLSSRGNLRARHVSARLRKMKNGWRDTRWRYAKQKRAIELVFFQWAETFIQSRHMASETGCILYLLSVLKSQSHFISIFECFYFSRGSC